MKTTLVVVTQWLSNVDTAFVRFNDYKHIMTITQLIKPTLFFSLAYTF